MSLITNQTRHYKGKFSTQLIFVGLAIAIGCMSGCYRYASVELVLRDPTNEKPLPNIVIEPHYRRVLEFFPPDLALARTNADGMASMRICTNYKSGYAGVYLHLDRYVIDSPGWGYVYKLPLDELRKGTAPHRIIVPLMTYKAWNAKYDSNVK